MTDGNPCNTSSTAIGRSPPGRATVAPIQLDRCSAICRTCVHALSRTRSGRRCRRSCRLRRRRQGDHRDHRGNGTRQSIGPRTSPRTHARRRSRRMPFAGSLADGSGALPGAAARRTLGGHSHDTSERALCLPAGRQHPSLWPEHSVPCPCRGTLSPLAACDASRPLARRRRAPARRSRFDRRQTAQARPTGIGNLDPRATARPRHIHVGEHPGLLLQEATYPNGGVHGDTSPPSGTKTATAMSSACISPSTPTRPRRHGSRWSSEPPTRCAPDCAAT